MNTNNKNSKGHSKAKIEGAATDITERKRGEEALQKRTHDLGERIKELSCLYGISSLVDRPGISLEEVLKGIVDLIPPSWQYPEITCARIILEGKEFSTENFRESTWKLDAEIIVDGNRIGTLEVYYLQEKPVMDEGPFLKEERNLINAIAERLGETVERKRAEQALKESEERYRDLFQSANDVVLLVDADGNIRDINKLGEKSSGYRHDELIQMNVFRDLIIPDDHKSMGKVMDRLREGKGQVYQVRWRTKDGTVIPFEGSSSSLVSEERTFIHTRCILRDVTERKQAEKALLESEEKYRQLVSTTTDAIMVFDADTRRFLEINKACEDLYGYSREEFLSLTHKDITAEPQESDASIQKTLNGEIGKIPVRHHRKKDGTVFSVEISASSFELGGRRVLCGVVRDITERKRAEEALRESEEKYRGIYDESVAAIYVFDAKKNFVDSNQAGLDLLGYSRDELLRMSIPDVDADPVVVLPAHEQLLSGERLVNYEHQLKKKDGTIITVLNNSRPLTDVDGNAVGMQSTLIDITERKRAEEALRKSEKQASAAIEAARALTFNYDIATGKIDWGGAIEEITGYTREEFAKVDIQEWVDRIHPHDRDEILSILRDAMEKDRATAEYRFKTKKGYVTLSSISLTEKQDGKVVRLVGILQDITERKQAEEALRASENKYKTLLENLPQKIFLKDKNSVYLSCNENYAGDLKIKSDEIVGKTDYDFFPKDLAEKYRADDKRIMESGKTEDIEERYIQNGREVIVHTVKTPVRDEQGNLIGLLGIFWDITDKKLAEETLQRSFSELSSLFDGLPLGVAYLSPDLRFVRVNKTLEAIIGHKEEQLLGKFCYDVIGEHAQDPTKKGKEKICSFCKTIEALKEGRIEEIERPLGDKILHVISSPIKDAKGEVTGVMELTEDISEKKKMEAQLIQAERLSAVGTLAYGIAHEFNNILAGILGNAEFGMGNNDPQEVAECFRVIMESCDRATSITNSLLAFSRQRQAKKQRADITETVETVLGLTERELEKQNVKVVRKFRSIPEITCDSGELSGAVLNMITNARDAMKPDGGTLTIEIGKRGDNIEMSFTDTGCGIPDSIKSRIFEPFMTTKGALGQSEIPGTGLGLFLSYGIISRYHGKIGVKSEKGKGSKFTIKIPISKNQKSPALVEPEEEKPSALPQNLNILLVDDEEPICTAIKKFFEAKGVSVTTALSGKKGFEIFKKGSFDLVLADITMPDMDGVELISKLKKIDQQVKFIVLTGHIAEDKLESAKRAGADEILMKPFRNEELYQVVGRVLSA